MKCLWRIQGITQSEELVLTAVVSTLAGVPEISGYKDGPASSALFSYPVAVASDTNGSVFVADAGGSVIRKISSSGLVSTIVGQPLTNGYADGTGTNALFSGVQGLALGKDGSLYAADSGNSVIRKVTAAGVVRYVCGQSRLFRLAGRHGHKRVVQRPYGNRHGRGRQSLPRRRR